MNVFATTASNATTSSFACYYDEKRKTFLADVYSIKVCFIFGLIFPELM